MTEAAKTQPGNSDIFSDEALVDAIVKRGSRQHFRTLIARHKDRIHGIALSVLGPRFQPEAEDVAQEAFIAVYHRLHTFRGESRFTTWLYRLTFNLAIDHRRRLRRADAGALEERGEIPGGERADEALEKRQAADRVAVGVRKLPHTQRIIVHLYYWKGFKTREIAEVLACPEGTVKVYLLRARKALAAELGEMLDE